MWICIYCYFSFSRSYLTAAFFFVPFNFMCVLTAVSCHFFPFCYMCNFFSSLFCVAVDFRRFYFSRLPRRLQLIWKPWLHKWMCVPVVMWEKETGKSLHLEYSHTSKKDTATTTIIQQQKQQFQFNAHKYRKRKKHKRNSSYRKHENCGRKELTEFWEKLHKI